MCMLSQARNLGAKTSRDATASTSVARRVQPTPSPNRPRPGAHAVISRPPRPRERGIPEATVARLPVYLRALQALQDKDILTVSSAALATSAGGNTSKPPTNLSH